MHAREIKMERLDAVTINFAQIKALIAVQTPKLASLILMEKSFVKTMSVLLIFALIHTFVLVTQI